MSPKLIKKLKNLHKENQRLRKCIANRRTDMDTPKEAIEIAGNIESSTVATADVVYAITAATSPEKSLQDTHRKLRLAFLRYELYDGFVGYRYDNICACSSVG